MDPVLQKALDRRAQIKRLRDELGREDDELDIFIKMHRRLSGDAGETTKSELMARTQLNRFVHLHNYNLKPKRLVIEEAAERILKEKQPQQTPELVASFLANGVEIGGTDPAINLASYLSKSEKFISSRKDGGWFLAEDFRKRAPLADDRTQASVIGEE